MILRVLVAGLSVGTIGHVVWLVPRFLDFSSGREGAEYLIIAAVDAAFVATLGAAFLGALLALRSWRIPSVRGLALFLATAATSWGAILRLMEFDIIDGQLSAATVDTLPVLEGLVVAALPWVAGAFLRVTGTFPQVLGSDDVRASGVRWVGVVRSWFLDPRVVWICSCCVSAMSLIAFSIGVPIGAPGWYELLWSFAAILGPGVFMVAAMVAALWNLVDGYRHADEADRAHLLWLLGGVAASTLMVVVPMALIPAVEGLDQPWIGNLIFTSWGWSPVVLVGSIALAVFYTGSVDPSLVLARGTLVGIGATLWIATYAGLEAVLSDWIQQSLGLPSAVISIALALVVASAAGPIRSRLAFLATRLGAPVPPSGGDGAT